jgi:hypothetical protein
MVREFTPSGVSAVEISYPSDGRGGVSPRKALLIQWLERLADVGGFGMGFANATQHERASFKSQ